MSSGKFFLGVIAGVAAGALIGVLLAPDKGSVTRQKLLQKGEDYADAIKDKVNDLIDTVSEKFEHVKDEVEKEMPRAKGTKKDVESSMI